MQMIIGQALGIISTIIGVCSFQVNTKRKLLFLQSVATICTCLSYLFLGAQTGFAMNIVCLARNGVFYFQKNGTKASYILTGVFMAAMAAIGVMSWQDPFSLLLIIALVANTFFMCLGNPQMLRYSILVTSTLVLIYNIHFFAIGGIAYESLAIVSSIIGIIRFRKEKTAK